MNSMDSPSFQISFLPEDGAFNLIPEDPNIPALIGCRMQVEIGVADRKRALAINHWHTGVVQEIQSPQGRLTEFQLEREFQDPGVECRIQFALSRDFPICMWKIHLQNTSDQPIRVDKIQFLRVGGQEKFGSLGGESFGTSGWSFYSNGWQSWSPTAAYQNTEPMRISRLGFLQQPMIIDSGTPVIRHPGYFTSTFFAALRSHSTQSGLVVGFLSQKQHFGSIEAVLYDRPSLELFTADGSRLDPGEELETDWAVVMPLQTGGTDPLGGYLEAVAREHGLTEADHRPMPNGWCSWYHYYGNITAGDVSVNLMALSALRSRMALELVQIDDGYETSVGDWFSLKPGFHDGLKPLADQITAAGFTAGLWLAPFILDPRSDQAHSHPEILLRNKRGKPVNAGFGWNRLAAGIDLTAPGAMQEVIKPISTAVEIGFPYLKLDFLYAAALPGLHYDPTLTRARIMRRGMEEIRLAAGPDTYILGCGLPLGSGIGLVDAMRISADVAGSWQPEFHGIGMGFKAEPAMPSVRNALHNILTRAPLHRRWWWNDPDCLLLGSETSLTLAEIQSMATAIGMTGGAVILSDDLTKLSADRLSIAQVLIPAPGQRAEVLDLLDKASPERLLLDQQGPQGSWTIIARINWQDSPQPWKFSPADFGLDELTGWFCSFWDEKIYPLEPGVPLKMTAIPAHGACLGAVIPHLSNQPAYLGSNLHFSQGCEVECWEAEEGLLTMRIKTGLKKDGYVRVFLPRQPLKIILNGLPANYQYNAGGIYQIWVDTSGLVEIKIPF